MLDFDIIVAKDLADGIGKDGKIPWDLPPDLHQFKYITADKYSLKGMTPWLIMGRKTFESLPSHFDSLNRRIMIVTSQMIHKELTASSLYEAFEKIHNMSFAYCPKIFVIGGGQIFKAVFQEPFINFINNIYVTEIINIYLGDTIFPSLELLSKTHFPLYKYNPMEYFLYKSQLLDTNSIKYRYQVYQKISRL